MTALANDCSESRFFLKDDTGFLNMWAEAT